MKNNVFLDSLCSFILFYGCSGESKNIGVRDINFIQTQDSKGFRINEEFYDRDKDGLVDIYVISSPDDLTKTRIFISKKFAGDVINASRSDYESIRVDYKSQFTKGLDLIKPEIMDIATQEEVDKRNRLFNRR